MMTQQQILDLVDETETPQIRAGDTHAFNDIWIVVANGRLFCRQYSFGANSWYQAFQQDPSGAIRCGDRVIPVRGVVPDDLDEVNPEVNEAYLDKYARRFTTYPDIARQMTGPPYIERTMELIPEVGE